MAFIVLIFCSLFSTPSAASVSLPGCPDKCGRTTIPYPFGTRAGCYHSPGFQVTCNATYRTPKAFVTTTRIEIPDISTDGTATVRGPVARDCYRPLRLRRNINVVGLDVTGLPYTFSYTRNKLVGLGCDVIAMSFGDSFTDYASGCASMCKDPSIVISGTCSGIGCCQTSIPKGIKRLRSVMQPLNHHTNTWNISPCSYAFFVDQDRYVFNVSDFLGFYKRKKVPVVMDWAIGNSTCEEAAAAAVNFACGANSYCTDSTNGPGYRCSCKEGYQGNPYIANGCQDINECKDPAASNCVHACENTPGSYICTCPLGYDGDGKADGKGCSKPTKKFPFLQVVLGSGLGFLFLLVSCSWLYWGLKKRSTIRLREKFFIKNGGLLLQPHESSAATARVFTAKELETATENYSERRVLGEGGNGIVYKGILSDGRAVAVKKSRIVDESQTEQFINEVVVLSHVVHKNVVRILGCCLETRVPLLVYEYVPNGALFCHIHGKGHRSSLSWETRMTIATETAGALSYLHSAAARPVFHRDVKSANILLNDNYVSKVSDFGASRLIPLDRAEVTTLVQGTLGYLDPEYFQTGQLTEKSDVYSFGVVMAELLTGQKPLCRDRSPEEQNLAMYFLASVKRNCLFEILEPRVRNEGSREQLAAVAEVTGRCLRLKGEDRPSMKEVAAELERSRRQENRPQTRS